MVSAGLSDPRRGEDGFNPLIQLNFYDVPGQWCVVGDTFPVGAQFSSKIIYPETFEGNPDTKNETYSTMNGIYEPHCGIEALTMSYGHDEYLYQVLKSSNLPKEGLGIIRFHSFYAW
jgi:inositol oxygenase